MTTRVGVHVTQDEIRLVVVRDSVIISAEVGPRDRSADAGAQLGVLLRAAVARWGMRRPALTIALSPHGVHSKSVLGLPVVAKRADLEQMLSQNAARFFLGDASTRQFSAVRHGESVLAESYDRALVAALSAAAHEAGWRRASVVSAYAALAAVIGDGDIEVACDSAMSRLSAAGGCLVRISCEPDGERAHIDIASLAVPSALAAVDREYLHAYGATLVPLHASPHLLTFGNARKPVPPWRARLAVCAMLVSSALLGAAPFLAVWRSSRASAAEVAMLTKDAAAATATWHALSRVGSSLDAIARFRGSERSVTETLSTLVTALPDDAALVAFAMDSSGGSLVTISERAMDVLASLDTVPMIAPPRLSGPITREKAGDMILERAPLHFTWRTQR